MRGRTIGEVAEDSDEDRALVRLVATGGGRVERVKPRAKANRSVRLNSSRDGRPESQAGVLRPESEETTSEPLKGDAVVKCSCGALMRRRGRFASASSNAAAALVSVQRHHGQLAM
jgi:hypothetical protein